MKNPNVNLSREWVIHIDSFENVPLDISEEKLHNVFQGCEDLLWIQLDNYHLDLGYYGWHSGRFTIYLYRGKDWHDCMLFEKVNTTSYSEVIDLMNKIVKSVEAGEYDFMRTDRMSISDYVDSEISMIAKKNS